MEQSLQIYKYTTNNHEMPDMMQQKDIKFKHMNRNK